MSSNEVKRRAVPKFTSFAPATPAPEVDSEKQPSTDQGPSKDQEKKDRERRHRHRDHDRDRRRDSDREREREREGRREREKDRDKHFDRHHSRYHERDRHHRRRSASPASLSKENPSSRHEPSQTTQGNNIFYFDKKEDPLIWRYGGNERSKIPPYRRFGAGKVIGSPGYLSTSFEGSKELFTIRNPGEGRGSGSVFRDKTLMSWAKAKGAKAKHIKSGVDGENRASAAEDIDGDFISLEPPRKRQRADESPEPGNGEKTPDYRSIYGKAKSEDEESDADETSSDSGSEDKVGSHLSEMSAAKKRSLELHRQIKNSPGDTKSWLELTALQDTLFREHQLEDQSIVGNQVKALAEIKLSLYEEALPHATDISLKDTLLNGMMHEGEKVWDPKQLAKWWEEITKANSDSFLLWVSRLNFELSQVATFTYGEMKNIMVTKLQALSQTLQAAAYSDENNAATLCSQLLYVFIRLTCYLRDSGYVELAVAAWQATLELNFCRPSNASDIQSVMEDFSDFWESEVPRIGEENAKGWRFFVEDMGDMADPPEAITRNPPRTPQTKDPFKTWASLERQQASEAKMPARTLDEGTDDDPFRIVMFSDIKDLVLWFPGQVLSQAQPQLVEALLTFCRLPTRANSALKDSFIAPRGQAFDSALNQLGRHKASTSVEIERKPPLFGQQGGNMVLSQELLFSGQDWFQYLGQWSASSQETDGEVDPAWVLETLRYLVLSCGVEQLAEYYLALAWLHEPSGAKKVAKGLLKRYSSSMRLYNAYAMIEHANGNVDMAEKVLASATSQNAADSQLLWNTWVWMHLKAGRNQLALLRLLSSVDSTIDVKSRSPMSPALLLKARSHFSTRRDYSLSSHQLEPALQYAESFALLEYLSTTSTENSSSTKSPSQGNIASALANIQSFATELQSLGHQILHERLLQTAARLLYHHATHGPYKPSTLRQHLHNFIRLFPHNTMFLSLLAWAEQSTLRINDPVRSIVRESLSSSSVNESTRPEDSHLTAVHVPIPISTYLFAIEYELLSGAGLRQPGTATIHSTKAVFEAAVSDPSACKYNVDIWIGYIRFLMQVYLHALSLSSSPGSSAKTGARENGTGRKKTDAQTGNALKAFKDVFYRAVAACPWSKRLYMEAFSSEALVNELSSGELRTVAGTMVAKGLRVHVDFEGFERKWKEKEEEQERAREEKERAEKEESDRRAILEQETRRDLENTERARQRDRDMRPEREDRRRRHDERYSDRGKDKGRDGRRDEARR